MEKREFYVTGKGKPFAEEHLAREEQLREDLEDALKAAMIEGRISEFRADVVAHGISHNAVLRQKVMEALTAYTEKSTGGTL
jgi:predicted exporter